MEETTRLDDTIEGVVSDQSKETADRNEEKMRSLVRELPFANFHVPSPDESSEERTIGNLGNPDFIHVIQLNRMKKRLECGESIQNHLLLVDTSDRIKFDVVPNLTQETVHNCVQDVITMILNYAGYDTASNNALQTLVHVCDSFLTQICTILKNSMDNRQLRKGNNTVHKDIFDTLDEVGFGVHDLHNYYLSISKKKRRLVHELTSKYQVTIQDPRKDSDDQKMKISFLQPLDLSHGFVERIENEDNVQEAMASSYYDKTYEQYDLLTEKEILADINF